MTPETPEYDVAISFLAKDQGTVGPIAESLKETLKVFYFPRSQEALAGTDGLESMRVPFVSGSRITVVFYREPWGETEWTRLEESAIKDGCLRRGWSTLLFVQLDKTSKLPKWLPDTHVRFVFDDYGTDELIGAIKARVQEHGGTIQKPNAVSRAAHVKREAEFLAEKTRLFRDRAWIEQTVQASALQAVLEAAALIQSQSLGMQPPIRVGAQRLHCIATDDRVSMGAGWKQEIFNDVGQDAHLFIRTFSGGMAVTPTERRMYIHQPKLIEERKFMVELTPSFDISWKEERKRQLLTTDDLAHEIAIVFFDLIGRANRGEIEMPFL